MRPQAEDTPGYFQNYVKLVKQDNLINALTETKKEFLALIHSIDPKIENYAYAEGKWTIKEVIIHCMDTERIFSTRALGFARGETQKALSYNENIYAPNSEAALRTLKDIYEECDAITTSTFCLFKSFSEKSLAARGETPAGWATVNAIGYTICGHTTHHINILKERYLKI